MQGLGYKLAETAGDIRRDRGAQRPVHSTYVVNPPC